MVTQLFAVLIFSNIHYDCCIKTDELSIFYSSHMHFQPVADDNSTVAKVIRYSAVLLHEPWALGVCLTLRSYAGGIWLTLIMKGKKNLNKSKRLKCSLTKSQLHDCACIYDGKTHTHSGSSLQDLAWFIIFILVKAKYTVHKYIDESVYSQYNKSFGFPTHRAVLFYIYKYT